MKGLGLTEALRSKLTGLSEIGVCGTSSGAVKCVDIGRNAGAKAAHWVLTDAETRKPGERTGLDTPVVLAVNDEH